MLTPYYEDELVTLYHGDCRLILPLIREEQCSVTKSRLAQGVLSA